jgi:regulatory protein
MRLSWPKRRRQTKVKITSISVQVRNPDRVNISIDGKYRLSLDIYQLTELGVKNGAEVSDEQIAEWEAESTFGKLYGRALEYTMIRPHSAKEIRDYLWRKTLTRKQRVTSHESRVTKGITYKKKSARDDNDNRTSYLVPRTSVTVIEKPGVAREIADRVYERLVEKGYIDDEKFVRFWLENRNLRKGTSQRKLIAELRSKGIEQGIIDALLPSSTRSDSSELQKIIMKKAKRYDDPKKLMQYLMRQGFSYDDVRNVMNNQPDEEESA